MDRIFNRRGKCLYCLLGNGWSRGIGVWGDSRGGGGYGLDAVWGNG